MPMWASPEMGTGAGFVFRSAIAYHSPRSTWSWRKARRSTSRRGDALVQRGTVHCWGNRGKGPCVMALVLVDAKPPPAGGKVLIASGERQRYSKSRRGASHGTPLI